MSDQYRKYRSEKRDSEIKYSRNRKSYSSESKDSFSDQESRQLKPQDKMSFDTLS